MLDLMPTVSSGIWHTATTQQVEDHRGCLALVPDIWMQLLSHKPQGCTGQKPANTDHCDMMQTHQDKEHSKDICNKFE